MPAAGAPPTLAEFLTAYGQSVRGKRGALYDVREGSGFELPGGVNAILMSRQARRDQRLFRNAYADTATGVDLDRHIQLLYGVTRTPEAFGQGFVILQRPAGGAAGTIWQGSRFELFFPGTSTVPVQYKASGDYAVAASDTTIQVLIEAARSGAGVAADTDVSIRLGDELFDPTFALLHLRCADGADEERDNAYVVRARQDQLDRRVGYDTSIIQACHDAGATLVVLLSATALGPSLDRGLNYVYVADDAYVTTTALRKACLLALDAWTIAGCDTQVLGMQRASVQLAVQVVLYDDPNSFNLTALKSVIVAKLIDEFVGRSNWWSFRLNALQGAVQSVSQAIQSVTIASTPGEPAVAFPSVLTRYIPSDIQITFTKAA